MLFLFYVNVSRMHPWSYLSYQPLMILASWVILGIGWSIPITASCFLAGNREDEVQQIWKEYFEDLYNIDTQ